MLLEKTRVEKSDTSSSEVDHAVDFELRGQREKSIAKLEQGNANGIGIQELDEQQRLDLEETRKAKLAIDEQYDERSAARHKEARKLMEGVSAGTRAKSYLLKNPNPWLAEKKKEVMAGIREIRPRLEYLERAVKGGESLLDRFKGYITDLASKISSQKPKADYLAGQVREKNMKEKSLAEVDAKGVRQKLKSDRENHRLLKKQYEELQRQKYKLDEISLTVAWPTEADLED